MLVVKKRQNFCEMNPFFYKISFYKEITKRNLKDFL